MEFSSELEHFLQLSWSCELQDCILPAELITPEVIENARKAKSEETAKLPKNRHQIHVSAIPCCSAISHQN